MKLTVSGAELAVDVAGAGRPLVFLNGFGSYKAIWTAQVAAISRWAQTVCFDYRGQGESTGAVATSLAQLADDVYQIIVQLGLKRPLLVGHSMGAGVLWALRQRYPKVDVSGLMVVDQSPKMLNDAEWTYGFQGLTAQTASVQLHQPRPGHETLHGMAPAVMAAFIRAERRHPFARKSGTRLLLDHFQADWRAVACHEPAPVLFVTATLTPYFINGYGRWLARRNPRIREVMIPNCGHDFMAEVPEAFNQTLRHFMLQHK